MLKPEIAMEPLAKNGIIVYKKEARKVLELLCFLVKLSVYQLVNVN